MTPDERVRQLTLPVDFPVHHTFDNFVVTPTNRPVVEHLRRLAGRDKHAAPGDGRTRRLAYAHRAVMERLRRLVGADERDKHFVLEGGDNGGDGCERQVALCGGRGVGKTHLLRAVCQAASVAGLRAAWVPVKRVLPEGGGLLDGLDSVPVVCLDDIDAIGRDSDWQLALFRLINNSRARGHVLLTASRVSPRDMDFLMRDVSSRLLWGVVYALEPMSDKELARTMACYARARNYVLTERATQYMVNNLPHDLTTLTALLDRLGNLSREGNREITVPLVKRLRAEADIAP